MTALSDMSLAELWELFPISLVAHDEKWAGQYAREAAKIERLLGDSNIARISHIGSTAIDGIWAKDIVDILVEAQPGEELGALSRALEDAGYIKMSESGTRISLNLGYTEDGFADEVFHIHLRHEGDNDELYFRDYLNDHPGKAREYERLKLDLWKRHERDRDAYTDAKAGFVQSVTAKAKSLYGGRYASA